MEISLSWLKEFVDIPEETNPVDLANLLTLKTAEIEKVSEQGKALENIVVGQIKEIKPHPNADKLRLTLVDVGEAEPLKIVCGGANLENEMLVAVAKIGAVVSWHGQETITMAPTKIRGEESLGMICAGEEIGIDDPNAGEKDILNLNHLKAKPGTPLAIALNLNDTIFEFDNKSLTHRPDLWGHYGIAREISALKRFPLKVFRPNVEIPKSGQQIDVKVDVPELCPRYCGLIIENIKVEESPEWLKTKLHSVGHGIHNNIVDVTNYVMAELGQPLHAFDLNNIEGGIIVRTANRNEKITTLKDQEIELAETMLVISDHKKPLAIAGVIGGLNSGITEKTTSIILESANFKASSVRKTSSKIGVRTDSVQRFEKSLDPHLAETAIKRAAELILKICPQAKIAGPITDIKNFDPEAIVKITLDTERARKKIGVNINNQQIQEILLSLYFKIDQTSENIFEITVPSYRSTKDVLIEDDLIEEIARIYGYDSIPPLYPTLSIKLPRENFQRYKKHKVRELLSYGLGFNETFNYSFYSETDLKKALLEEEKHIKIKNYLSEDQTHMQISLFPNLIKAVQGNLRNFDSFNLYQIAKTYLKTDEFYPLEENWLAGAIISKEKSSEEIFFEAKGAIETIAKHLNFPIGKAVSQIENTPYAHPKKGLTYLSNEGIVIAKCYLLHPQATKNFELEKTSIACFEINFSQLVKIPSPEIKFQEIPKFPAIQIDVAVIVDEKVKVDTLEASIRSSSKELIKDLQVFDIYRGPGIEEGKKSIAFQITLRADDRTLTEQEMTKTQEQIWQSLEKSGGQIRRN